MTNDTHVQLPSAEQLEKILVLTNGSGIHDLLNEVLLLPMQEFMQRPAKKIRGRLVELGFRLAGEGLGELTQEEKKLCLEGSEALETLHAGSLVVDDIQDNSKIRRGEPTLHIKHGVGVALNVGNWLYFWALDRIRHWGLAPEIEVNVYHIFHQALLRAHSGQALDVSIKIDEVGQKRVSSICLSSLELKTGALMSLAIGLGGALRSADTKRLTLLEAFGNSFGIALQMFDDIGNMKTKEEKPDPKQYEDLLLRRPTWVWAVAAETLSPLQYQDFTQAVRGLPNDFPLKKWLKENNLLTVASERALLYLNQSIKILSDNFSTQEDHSASILAIKNLAEKLRKAYE